VLDLSNLPRQVIHQTKDVGLSKVDSAKTKILALNPHVAVETHDTRLSADNALEIIGGYDIVVDGVDNFPTKFLINDACFFRKKPPVHSGGRAFGGCVSTRTMAS